MNKLHIFGRILAAIVALVALGSGIGMMFNPDGLLGGLSVTPDGTVGYSSLRALIGGSQIAMGVIATVAVFRGRADAILVVAVYFTAVLLGRLVGLALDGVDPFSVRASAFAAVFMLLSFSAYGLLSRPAGQGSVSS